MFVLPCLSVCFRNVGCWHVPVLGPVAFAQGSKKKKKKKKFRARGGTNDFFLHAYVKSKCDGRNCLGLEHYELVLHREL